MSLDKQPEIINFWSEGQLRLYARVLAISLTRAYLLLTQNRGGGKHDAEAKGDQVGGGRALAVG
jgi:hypothetical protein